MKKLMIAALAIAFGAVAQAATVSWSADGIQINGDWETGEGDMMTSGWGVYFFDNNGAYSQSTMIGLLAAATTVDGYANWVAAMGNADSITAANADGGAADMGVSMNAVGGEVEGYLVLIDNSSLADATHAFVSEVTATADKSPVVTNLILGNEFEGYINATGTWSEVGAVPEPTSGLLLLLGMAGLALRRKQA